MNLSNSTRFYHVNTSGDWNYVNANNSYLPAAGFALQRDTRISKPRT